MRINRFLAGAGLGSRRKCEDLIREGRVTLNGKTVEALATMVSPEDSVKVDGRRVRPPELIYALLHKPKNVLCSKADMGERNRQTVFDLIPPAWKGVTYVGRLDYDSEGLLIMTNDGDLNLRLTHPRFKVDKEYIVRLDKPFDPTVRAKLMKGVVLDGIKARFEDIRVVGPDSVVRVVLRQGLKRQIRRMLFMFGYEVKTLIRIRTGKLELGTLGKGQWRPLTSKEVASLKGEDRGAAKSK